MMKKLILALLLLIGLYQPVRAQQAPAAPVATVRSQRDTLDAISRHYSRRRRGGYVWLGIGTGGLLTLVRVLANPNTTTVNGQLQSSSVDGGAAATVGIFFVALPVSIGISKLARYSIPREDMARQAYSKAHMLPQGWGRRLQRKDFR